MRRLSLFALLLGAMLMPTCVSAGSLASLDAALQDMELCTELKAECPDTWIHDFLVIKGESSEHAGVLQIMSDITGSISKAATSVSEMTDAEYGSLSEIWFEFLQLDAETKAKEAAEANDSL